MSHVPDRSPYRGACCPSCFRQNSNEAMWRRRVADLIQAYGITTADIDTDTVLAAEPASDTPEKFVKRIAGKDDLCRIDDFAGFPLFPAMADCARRCST